MNNDENKLLDLQVFDIASRELTKRSLAHEITKIAFTVTVATLAAGLLAAGVYPNQKDKLKHVFYGSLMASLVTVSSYYGLDLSPTQSMWLGIAGTVIFSLLKEYIYDRHHRDIHTVDFQDAVATSIGGASSAVGLRYTLSW